MSAERLDYLDGWRGVAILCTLGHFAPAMPALDLGRFGVDLFFVLSGLLMTRILFEERMPLGQFYRRRASRILPAFLCFIAVLATLAAIEGRSASLGEILAYMTFSRTYDIHPVIWQSTLPAGNVWSLNVEEHCYLLLSLVAACVAPRRVPVVLFALGSLTWLAIEAHAKLATDGTANYLLNSECASTGLLLSAAYRSLSKRPQVAPWLPPAALLAALGCYLARLPWYAELIPAPILLAFAVNHISESWRWLVRALEAPWLRRLGFLSYSLYLWQQPFYKAHPHTLIYIVPAVLTGVASFYLVESPLRRWLNANWGKRDPVVSLAQAQ